MAHSHRQEEKIGKEKEKSPCRFVRWTLPLASDCRLGVRRHSASRPAE